MKRKKISRLLCLATLVIVAILTACPAADSISADSGKNSKKDSVSGPKFQSLDIDVVKKKIIVSFNTKISGKPDASRITVKRGSTPLSAAEYTPTIENGKLIIKLHAVPTSGAQYTVELQGGAVKDANGKANTSSKDKTLTVSLIQAITTGSLTFKANSGKVLTLSFNTNIEIVDKSKIKVEVRTGGTEKFTAVPVTSAVNTTTGNLLELTLAIPAIDDNVYRVKVGAGALRATESKLLNAEDLSSSEITYSTSPILNTPPYILDNKLVATFNLTIALKDWTKVKVYKDPDGDNQEINLNQGDIAVNSDNLLEITLPAVQATEIYRLRLETGAVNEEGKGANENQVIESADINIEAAPALDADNDPYLSGQKIIVPFNAPIRILEPNKIKYQLNGTTITPTTKPTVENNNQLEISLDEAPEAGQIYRIELDAGALSGGKNKSPVGAIQPDDKNIYSTSPILNANPYILDNKLVVTFNLPIALKDWTKVKVYKDPDGDNDGEAVTLVQGNVTINRTSRNLLEITLPAVQATEVYRLRLDAGAVSEEGEAANENKPIEPKDRDITIEAAPALDADNDPYLYGQKIIVPFNAPIRILNPAGIKYRFKADERSRFGAAIEPADPKVLNTNQLEIPLNAIPEGGQVYRIDLDAGALGGGPGEGKNQPSMSAIQPNKKDITVIEPTLTNIKPVATSKTQLSVTFPVDVDIMDNGSRINVQKKDDRDNPDTAVDESSFRTVSSRTIEVDGENSAKINITLTDDEEITPYTQVWRLIFPPKTVETAKSKIPNSRPLTTEGSEKPRLTDLYSWREITAEGNKWSNRSGHTSVVFDSKIWVMGGRSGELLNDVWSTEDGVTWTEETPRDSGKITSGADKNWWTARTGHTSVMFNRKIWVMGGHDGKILNDVWSSPDGDNWTQVDDAAKWPARYYHNSVVFDPDGNGERIWVLGGFDGKDLNDVWSSANGSTWTESIPPGEASKKTDGADANWWKPRYFSGSAVFQNKIWIMGGSFVSEDFSISNKSYSTLWSSSDGQTWTKGNDFDNTLSHHSMVAFEGRLWNLGGVLNTKSTTKRIQSSVTPADSWVEEKVLPSTRQAHSTVMFDNRIWVMGGGDGTSGVDNKVLVLEPNFP